MHQLSLPILAMFILYVAIVFLIGIRAIFHTHNLSDYILGGRNLSGPVAGLGAGASDMSGWLLMALPGAAFVAGINEIWLPIGLATGAFLNWYFVAKRLRIYTELANNSLTVPAYLENRFNDKSKVLRSTTALVILLFFTFYASAGFVAGAFLTQSLFHLNYLHALLITGLIIVAYTCIGGFLAVSWVDFFQGTLMFFALLIVPIITMLHVGGWHELITKLAVNGKDYFDAFHGISVIGIFSLLAWGLGYFGQPHILVRFMAAKSSKVIPLARFICMTWMILALYGAIFTGLTGNAYFHSLTNPETVFILLAQNLFNPWIAGILIAAVLSAIMSTVAAQMLASTSALTEDFYRAFSRKNASHVELVIVARISLLIIAAIALWIASKPGGTILQLVAYAWSGLGASFGPIIIISLYWHRMTRNSAIGGMLTGAVTVIVWEILGKRVGSIFTLYSIIPGFLLNSIVVYGISLLGKKPPQEVREVFAEVEKNC